MQVPIRLSDDALADIQGFITSGFGHLTHAGYLFVEFREAGAARRWLDLVVPAVTTSSPWPTLPTGEKVKPAIAVNVAFTAGGLAALEVPARVRCTFPVEFQEGIACDYRSRILGDTEESEPAGWEIGGTPSPPVHAVVIIHALSADELDAACDGQRAMFDATRGGVIELPGSGQRGYRPEGDYEPFGFHDGIAQPSIAGIGGKGVPTGEFILGYANHYGIVPPTPVVSSEFDAGGLLPVLDNPHHARGSLRDLGLNGSYVVYRKLRQDVAGFWRFLKQEATRSGAAADSERVIWLASRLVGRWPSGAPLMLAPHRDDPGLADRNDFLYGEDPIGTSCPLGAHVRRANPRDGLKPYPATESLSMSEAHRLLRRARVFGPPLFDPAVLADPASAACRAAILALADDGRDRGIHFFCVNASIRGQFEFVQQTWCNNPRFGGLNDNKDAITGDNDRTGQPSSHMTVPGCPLPYRTGPLPRFVTVRAGAYLFMPGIRALRYLSASRRPISGRLVN